MNAWDLQAFCAAFPYFAVIAIAFRLAPRRLCG
jgi:hypothetical protein